jgi:hypothetical protein
MQLLIDLFEMEFHRLRGYSKADTDLAIKWIAVEMRHLFENKKMPNGKRREPKTRLLHPGMSLASGEGHIATAQIMLDRDQGTARGAKSWVVADAPKKHLGIQ